jgi:hypothetical protein
MEWNQVTWYSKLFAAVLYVSTFFFAFYLGFQFDKAVQAPKIVNTPTTREWKLSPGESIQLGNFTFTLNSVSNDSRCPSDVQCIQAGNATANLELGLGNQIVSKSIKSNGETLDYGGYKISVTDVTPTKKSGTQIKQSDYRLVFQFVTNTK